MAGKVKSKTGRLESCMAFCKDITSHRSRVQGPCGSLLLTVSILRAFKLFSAARDTG